MARGPGGGVGGAPSDTGENGPMTMTDLVDLGLALVSAIVAIAVGHVPRAPNEGRHAPQQAAWEALRKAEATC